MKNVAEPLARHRVKISTLNPDPNNARRHDRRNIDTIKHTAPPRAEPRRIGSVGVDLVPTAAVRAGLLDPPAATENGLTFARRHIRSIAIEARYVDGSPWR